VALTDGAEALQQQVGTHVPEYPLLLDIIHATESRWDTANAWLGEPHPQRRAWVRAYLEPLLAGQSDAVRTTLAAEAKNPTCTGMPRQAVRLNGHWDAYGRFHRQHHHQRLYGRAAPAPALAEARALEWAA
jgi:hypothetical protein